MAPILSRSSSAGGGGGFGFGRRRYVDSGAPSFTPSGKITASGGNIANAFAPGNGYKYHTFTTPGTFTISSGSDYVDLLVVAGGGGTGPYSDSRCGGGGAGGVAYWPQVGLTPGPYSIVVGNGGSAENGPAGNGGDSSFAPATPVSVVAIGGGGSGGGPRGTMVNASPGGSGGGGGGFDSNTNSGQGIQPLQNPGRTGLLNYGNPGGAYPGNRPDYASSEGGGGAGEAGNQETTQYGGKGGNGVLIAPGPTPGFYGPLINLTPLSPMNGYFGGGGNSNYFQGSTTPANTRPLGGGGTGANPSTPPGSFDGPGIAAISNTGGGAGGGGAGPSGTGVQGGSGIVVIRYLA